MDIKEYAEGGQALYGDFAETVDKILNQAIVTAGLKANRPQSQHRAKDAARLRLRLEEKGQGAAADIEDLRKDLAGCRLIFYTNGDLNEFLHSSILRDNFDIDYDSTKIHHPVAKDGSEPEYRGYNFVVKLKENRASLPEYARFSDLRCEVQLQTILNHAWAETSHDIVYKQPFSTEFAKKGRAQIDKRFREIMRKYLVPAGHEFDKVKHDFESLMQGKPIFEKGPLLALKDAADNNERRDVLERIREHYLPNHDDPNPLVPELLATVEEAVGRSRGTPHVKIITSYGEMDGWAGDDVIDAALDLLDLFRYVNPEATLDLLVRLMKQATGDDEKQRILKSVESLATVPLRVVQQAGGEVHLRLMRRIERLDAADRGELRSLVLKVCEEILKSDLAGTFSSYKSVTFERGAMPATKELEVARTKAIDLLKALYRDNAGDINQLTVLQHLSEATRTPTQGQYTNGLVAIILRDSVKIAAFLAEILPTASYEIKKAIEHDAWNMYRILCLIPFDNDDGGALLDLQRELGSAVLKIRDELALDEEYEIFKTLVSLHSIYAPAWEAPKFDFRRDDAWRSTRVAVYLADFTAATAETWWSRMELCAASQSTDGAAYFGLQELLRRLNQEKPELVLQRLDALPENVASFLPLILSSLAKSRRAADLKPILGQWANEGKHILSIARHYQITKQPSIEVLSDVLRMAVQESNPRVAIEVVASLVNAFGQPDKAGKALLLEAVAWLTTQGRSDWLEAIWYMQEGLEALADNITQDERGIILNALVTYPRADHHLDFVLAPFAAVDLRSVLAFFAARLTYAASSPPTPNYDAVPYALTDIKALSAAPVLVLDVVLGWLRDSIGRGNQEVASFVHAAFPDISNELAAGMIERATKSKEDAAGVLEMLTSYNGAERVFEVCREIVGSLDSNDAELLRKVDFVLQQTGTVTGEFGFVQAYIAKKKIFERWLGDARKSVVDFATKTIAALERMIASEQNRSEQMYALERLNWGEPIEDGS